MRTMAPPDYQPHDYLLNCLFRRRSKKISKLRVTGLCAGNSPVTNEFPGQRASNAENVSVWWRHHVWYKRLMPLRNYIMYNTLKHTLWYFDLQMLTLLNSVLLPETMSFLSRWDNLDIHRPTLFGRYLQISWCQICATPSATTMLVSPRSLWRHQIETFSV